MPYCNQCGHEVHPQDLFCAKCGTRQPVQSYQAPDVLGGISPRLASILCYIPTMGWIAAILFLATQRFRTDRVVRFHAFQGLYLFAAWLFVQWAIKPVARAMSDGHFSIANLLEMVIIGVSIFMMIKASHQEAYSLPVIGELAQKSAAGK